MNNMNPIDSIKIQQEVNSLVKCEMNNLLITVHQNEDVESYQCPYCDNKPDNICKECIFTCHKDHHPNFKTEDINSQLKVKLSQFECQCAANGHKVGVREDEDDGNSNKQEYDYISIAKEFLTNIGSHDLKEKELADSTKATVFDIILEIIIHWEHSKNDQIAFNRIPSYLFMTRYFEVFFPSVKETIKKLEEKSNPANYEPRKAKRSVSVQYENEMKNMMLVFDMFKSKSIYFDRESIKNIFNYSFMKRLFSVNKFNQKDDLLETKYQALRSFIDLHIKPLTNQKFRRMLTTTLMNTSPVHRATFRQNLSEFFLSINIQRDDYLNLINSIYQYLMSAYEFEELVAGDTVNSQIYLIFFQYLRLIKFMFCYDITSEVEMIDKYLHQILEINLYSMNKVNNLRELQKFVPIVINDIKCSENEHRDKILFFFENSPLNLDFVKQFFSNYDYNNVESKDGSQNHVNHPTENLFQTHAMHDTIENQALMEEHAKENDDEVEEHHIEIKNHDHQAPKVTYQYGQNTYIYDILFTKNDLYLDSLSSLLTASKNYVVDDLREIAKDNEKSKTLKELFSTNEDYFKNKTFNSDHIELKQRVYNGDTIHRVTYEEITTYLNKIGESLGNSLNLCNITSKNAKQIWLTRNGLFSNILEVYSFLCVNYSERVFRSEIYKKILELVTKLVEDNSFLCSLLFNEKMLRFFPLETCPETYIIWLQTLKKDKYKINLFQFIEFNKTYLEKTHDTEHSDPKHKELAQKDLLIKLEIYHLMLKISSKKSLEAVNYHIWMQYRNKKSFFFEQYRIYLENTDKEDNDSTANADSKVISINKIILNMSLNYLYMIKTVLPLDIIGQILTRDNDMPPEHRISFVKLYDKCFVRYPYRVKDHFKLNDLQLHREVENKNSPDTMDPDKQPTDKATKLNNFFVELPPIRNNEHGTDPIIINIKFFEKIYNRFEKDSFNKNPRFLLKYFLNVVLIPAMDYLYKITYFSQAVTYMVKFKIYEVIHIFIKSYKNLLEIIEKNRYIKEEYLKLFSNFFVMSSDKDREKDKDLNLFLLKVVSKLDQDLKEFKSGNIDYMDHISMIKKFNDHAITMKYNLVAGKRVDKSKQNMEYHKKMTNFLNSYIKSKAKLDSWLLNTLVQTNRELESDYEIDKIKINIMALLFSYSKLNNISERIQEHVEDIVEPSSNYYMKLINKLIKQDPSFYQLEICKSKDIKIFGIYSLFKNRLLFFYQFVFIEFWNRSADSKNSFIDYFIRIIKFATFLCSKINVFFVNTLSSYIVYQEDPAVPISLNAFTLKFLTYMIQAMEFQSKKESIIGNIIYFDPKEKGNFFNRVCKRIFALHKEFLHCNAENIYNNELINSLYDKLSDEEKSKDIGYKNFLEDSKAEKLETTTSFKNLVKDTNKILLHMTSSPIYTNLFLEYLDFIHSYCYQHDYDFPIELKDILAVLYSLYEALYYDILKTKPANGTIGYINSHKKLLEMITKNDKILEYRNYQMLARLYIIINYCSKSRKNGKFEKLLENMKNSSQIEDDKELSNNKNLMWQREIFLFLRNLIRTVELSINYRFVPELETEYETFLLGSGSGDDKKNNNQELIKANQAETDALRGRNKPIWVFFQVRPEGIFIESNDVIRFWELAPYDKPHTKYEYLLDYFKYIDNLVHVRKQITTSHSRVLSALFKINYKYVEYFSLFMAILTNLLIILSISYSQTSLVDPLHNIIYYFSLTHLIVLFVFLFTLIRVELFKFQSLNKDLEKKIEIKEYVTKHLPGTTFLLFWNFIIGFMAITSSKMNFLYSLQLFSFFYFFETMNTVLKSISLKYKEFLSAGLLILIFILFYAIVSVIFFQDQFENADLNVILTF